MIKSLEKNTVDQSGLRQVRFDGQGRMPSRLVSSYFPYFYTREGATLSINGCYRGGSAFLIAGGPSFYKVDQSKLSCVWAMTLNNSSRSFRANANCIVDDPSRFSYSMWLDPTVQKFVPMSHFEKPLWDNRLLMEGSEEHQMWQRAPCCVGDCPNVVGYRRNEKFHPLRWLHEDTINWGNSAKYGGVRSVLLAAIRILYLLGFRKVFLLGVDFEMSPEKRYHFPEERNAHSIRGNNLAYKRLQEWFTALQPHFLKAGFEVKNCNPESKLTAFPYTSLDEALGVALSQLGNFKNEQTLGMYTSLEKKGCALTSAERQSTLR